MRPLPPHMQEEIRRKIAAGEELPPGVTLVPEGQVPPPGSHPTGMSAQANGRKIQAPEDLTSSNPVTMDANGLTLLRAVSKCPLPAEHEKMHGLTQQIIMMEDDDDHITNVLSRGLAVFIRANSHCRKHRKERIAVRFADDDMLSKQNEELATVAAEAEALHQKLQGCMQKIKQVSTDRWNRAVKTYGLDPSKNVYSIDEEEGTILQHHLNCNDCKGKAATRKSRQETEELIQESIRRSKEAIAKLTPRAESASASAPEAPAAKKEE